MNRYTKIYKLYINNTGLGYKYTEINIFYKLRYQRVQIIDTQFINICLVLFGSIMVALEQGWTGSLGDPSKFFRDMTSAKLKTAKEV